MLHEYLGYFYDYGDISGGVYTLEKPGQSVAIRDLIDGRLPKGSYTPPVLSYNARTVYFAFAARADEKTDFYSPQRRCFHIYAVNIDGTGLRRLTDRRKDRPMDADFYLLEPGTYTLSLATGNPGAEEPICRQKSTVVGPRSRVAFSLPSRRLCLLHA